MNVRTHLMDKEHFSDGGKCTGTHLQLKEGRSCQTALDEDTPEVRISLLVVITHKIGHALGLGRCDVPNAVIFPFYQIIVTLK